MGAVGHSANNAFDEAEEATACALRRKELADKHAICNQLQSPLSFRTYVNAVARVYKNAVPDTIIIPSSQRQFPEFNQFFASAVVRERARRAVTTTTHPSSEIHQVEEFRAVMGQRANTLTLAFCTGLRSEVLRRLVVSSFRESRTEDGTRMLTFAVGTMKNLPWSARGRRLCKFFDRVSFIPGSHDFALIIVTSN
ncbi:hypothetical protein M569_17465 [Genlisea aurea]|uniref:Uncharacterized protein n=1 Tax=Genlisea aurea TaxID=192259 RepID=S8D3Y9_9LAMI|nr:hypothetical protein M569_17465 [Genlisea aurea]